MIRSPARLVRLMVPYGRMKRSVPQPAFVSCAKRGLPEQSGGRLGGPWLEAQRSTQTRSGERVSFDGGLTMDAGRVPCTRRVPSKVGHSTTAVDLATATGGTSSVGLWRYRGKELDEGKGFGGCARNNRFFRDLHSRPKPLLQPVSTLMLSRKERAMPWDVSEQAVDFYRKAATNDPPIAAALDRLWTRLDQDPPNEGTLITQAGTTNDPNMKRISIALAKLLQPPPLNARVTYEPVDGPANLPSWLAVSLHVPDWPAMGTHTLITLGSVDRKGTARQ